MGQPRLRLFHYWRSSASWRVRFALEAKRIAVEEKIAVNLLTGDPESPEHRARNPMGYVPVLERLDPMPAGQPRYLAESLAIIEWLEETYVDAPRLLPRDPWLRARTRQMAELINSGTQPLINLGVGSHHSTDEAEQKRWNQHWIRKGLDAYEQLVRETAGRCSVGDELTLADICLIPQCYGAVRNEVPLEAFPTVARINAHVLGMEACKAAHPDRYAPAG